MLSIALAGLLFASGASGFDPPLGGDAMPWFYDVRVLGGASTTLGSDSPLAAALNPAASAAAQRAAIAFNYVSLVGFGPLSGWGSALSFGFTIPADYGVWNGSAHVVSVPAAFMLSDALPLGTNLAVKVSFAKDVYPDLWFGIGATASVGGLDAPDWGIALDIGFVKKEGKVGFLEDFRWGFALANAGWGFEQPATPGFTGTAPSSAYPSPFTLTASAAGRFVDVPSFSAGFSIDLVFPSFQNAILRASLDASIAGVFGLGVGYQFNARELIAGHGTGLYPSVSAFARIPLGSEAGDQASELVIDAATMPLYSEIRAIGASASILFGIRDDQAPRIAVAADPGTAIWLSPNGDKRNDALFVPVSIEDERYIVSWSLEVRDSSGAIVHADGADASRPDSDVFFFDALLYRKSGVTPPDALRWDGRTATGSVAPDGEYAFTVRATDDNGNAAQAGPFRIMIDATFPVAALSADPARLVFSPDGDGAKDALPLSAAGSVEALWRLEILDASGKAVRTQAFEGSSPSAWSWDGRDDAGEPVADGAYTAALRAEDSGGNAALAEVTGIIVDTSRPSASMNLGGRAFSPNGDGKRDTMEISLKLGSRERVESWRLAIVGAGGESREVSGGSGSAPPARYDFSGKRDDGSTMPEGDYVAKLRVEYGNGYSFEIDSEGFALDVTPPMATFQAVDASLSFSPDGDGLKDAFAFKSAGTREDLWTLDIRDGEGRLVRRKEFASSAPLEWAWDGRDDAKAIVADGVYYASLSCVDRADNSFSASVDNVIVNTSKPVASLKIDAAAFSPNGDGVKDSLTFMPSVSSKTAVLSWKLTVYSANGAAAWSTEGTPNSLPPESVPFSGISAAGERLGEGRYYATLSLAYANGFAHSVSSPPFTLDVTPPSAKVSVDRPAFNPAAAAGKNSVAFTQSGSREDLWVGEVLDSGGKVVRSFSFEGAPKDRASWDGLDDAGKLVGDGEYRYRLKSTDAAGNSFSTPPQTVIVDTEKKPVLLSSDQRAFSPNGDGVKDSIKLIAQVAAPERVESWSLTIRDASLSAARSWKGGAPVPQATSWDGKGESGAVSPDATYSAILTVRYSNGDAQESTVHSILLDTKAPKMELSASATAFNPEGARKEIVVAQRADSGDDWNGAILDASGRTVRSWAWKGKVADARWNGTDDAGNPVPDGRYSYVASAVDEAGNRGSAAIKAIDKDTRDVSVFVTSSAAGFSPNGDGKFDDVRFGLTLTLKEGVDSWRLVVADQYGKVRKSWGGKGAASIPQQQAWDGKGDDGLVLQGTYTASFTVDYARGDSPSSSVGPIALDVTAPRAQIAATPELFSPDGDGVADELSIEIAADDTSQVAAWKLEIYEVATAEGDAAGARRLFTSFSGTGRPAPRLAWDGKSSRGEPVESATDYALSLSVTDQWGNTSLSERVVMTDVLVVKDGSGYRIRLPAIVFQPMQVDFSGLSPDKAERNMKALSRVAAILLRFRDYKIVVEGHAVNGARLEGKSKAEIDKEEREFTVPFSAKRAEAIRQMLIGLGVDGSRMTAVGRGSSAPVVDLKDVANRWKNRRVEFLLQKN
jgi:flagellar hook assembly protein FlgD/outer membrane protein OmpA-like peptidoglycan-associated protein